MKCKTGIKLDFDPEELEDSELKEIFKNITAKVLWCCIKQGHLTDQHFCGKVLRASKELEKVLYQRYYISYTDFLQSCSVLTEDYGNIAVNEYHVIDNEFWVSMWDIIHGSYFKITFPEKIVDKEIN